MLTWTDAVARAAVVSVCVCFVLGQNDTCSQNVSCESANSDAILLEHELRLGKK